MEQFTFATTDNRSAARKSYTGSRLTEAQFDEAWNIADILHREIQRSGSFIEKLTDYARTFAGREKVDATREEMILRDIYTERFGQTLNKTREGFIEAERALSEDGDEKALSFARAIPTLIQSGETLPFYQAQDRAARSMAYRHSITELGAKKMMADAFEKAEGRSLYDVSKELEAKFHTPVKEAQREARKVERREMARSGPAR